MDKQMPARHEDAVVPLAGGQRIPATSEGRLVCFPPAGGGANRFRSWIPSLPPSLALLGVVPSGRDSRFNEPPADSLDSLATEIAAAIADTDAAPYALFGHSFGALLAYETAARLVADGHPPSILAVAGFADPTSTWKLGDSGSRVPEEDAMADELAALGGTPEEVLNHPELRQIALEQVRADLTLLDAFIPPPRERLPITVLAFAADQDPLVSPTEMRGWTEIGAADSALFRLPGGHFAAIDEPRPILDEIAPRLRAVER